MVLIMRLLSGISGWRSDFGNSGRASVPGMEAYMALPWIFDHFLKKSGGTMTGGLTLSDGSTAEGVVASGDGYIRYARGIQMCWGWEQLNGPCTATNKRVTFPKAFSDEHPRVFVSYNANSGNTPVGVGWESKTSFSIGTMDNTYPSSGTSWFAIGRWK